MFAIFVKFKEWIERSSVDAHGRKIIKSGMFKEEWRDEDGLLHRDDGPAAIMLTGDEKWFRHGKLHRDGAPAKISNRSTLPHWYVEKWFQHGKIHRDDGPAVTMVDGTLKWYRNGYLDRENGPAVEYASGEKEWWVRGKKMTEQDFIDWQWTEG